MFLWRFVVEVRQSDYLCDRNTNNTIYEETHDNGSSDGGMVIRSYGATDM